MVVAALHCSDQRTCASCEQSVLCGWCNDASDTGVGQCMEGGYEGALEVTRCNATPLWHFSDCPCESPCWRTLVLALYLLTLGVVGASLEAEWMIAFHFVQSYNIGSVIEHFIHYYKYMIIFVTHMLLCIFNVLY